MMGTNPADVCFRNKMRGEKLQRYHLEPSRRDAIIFVQKFIATISQLVGCFSCFPLPSASHGCRCRFWEVHKQSKWAESLFSRGDFKDVSDSAIPISSGEAVPELGAEHLTSLFLMYIFKASLSIGFCSLQPKPKKQAHPSCIVITRLVRCSCSPSALQSAQTQNI